MFEIIMLFAFLYAATCQLFPEEQAPTSSSSNKNCRPGKAKKSSLQRLPQKRRGAQKKPVKVKCRNHNYAHAA